MSFLPTRTVSVSRLRDGRITRADDSVIVEEPLEIRVDGRRFTTTVRTPTSEADDALLARGLLFSEGVIADNDDIEAVTFDPRCRDLSSNLINIVNVTLHVPSDAPAHLWERNLISNSSCGLCGHASIEALQRVVAPLPHYAPISADVLLSLNSQLREVQALFEQTGGLHAAGLFNARGDLLFHAEDIGRHNATDKVIGRGLQDKVLPWQGAEPAIMLVSGRASFEIAQKALLARVPVLCAVSAASSLAVNLARANNLTLIGFLRERGFTLYNGEVEEQS